jgi:hypothetical protein
MESMMTPLENPDTFMNLVYLMAGSFALSVLAMVAIAIWEDRR